jgi:uncharacterized membrane protein YhfC
MIDFWPFILSGLLMFFMPILLGWFIHRQRQARWGLFLIGMVGFVLSQLLHIPFNWLVANQFALLPTDTTILINLIIVALFYGLSAGVFEEVTRYLIYRFWAKDARTWGRGLMYGSGWGGVESMILGLIVLINAIVLAAMSQGNWLELVPAEQQGLLAEQIQAMVTLPWYEGMLGALERAFALCLHLSLSLMVMQVFTRGKLWWLWLAIGWHALVDATAVFAQIYWANAYLTEGIVAIFAVVSLGIIFWLRTPEPTEPELEPLPPPAPVTPANTHATSESLDRSKYS